MKCAPGEVLLEAERLHGSDPGPLEMEVQGGANGNLARQADRTGVRCKFCGSEIPWALMVG